MANVNWNEHFRGPTNVNWKDYLCGLPDQIIPRIREQFNLGISSQATNRYGKTLLHCAASARNIDVARLALEAGVPVDALAYPIDRQKRLAKKSNGWTALFYAISRDDEDIVRLLLDHGASEKRSYASDWPLSLAIRRQSEHIYWLLIERGFCKTNARDLTATPLGGPLCPPAVSNQLVRNVPSTGITRHCEKVILDSFGVGLSEIEDETFCSGCLSGLESTDDATRSKWQERRDRVMHYKGDSKAFNYGYQKRCEICRKSLTTIPIQFTQIPSSARLAILPSNTTAFPLIQKSNREEDLLYLLELRKLLSHGEDGVMGDPSSLLLPMYWLLRCLKNHTECFEEFEEPMLPRRFIHLGDEETPYLVDNTSQRQKGHYCTLSYRWGVQPLKLLTQNLDSFKQRIPTDELPPTIKQAMLLARHLGVQYMWVDALCIIQDSKQDCSEQVLAMDQIFAKSLLTIAAVDAFDRRQTSQGIFRTRKQVSERSQWRPRGLLDSRGWTLQEQILSRRTLSFLKSGIYWSCRICECSEKDPGGVPVPFENRRPSSQFATRSIAHIPRVQSWLLKPEPQRGYQLWQDLIVEYTARSLSLASDRYPAILGLGQSFSRHLGDELVAGIWRANCWPDLLWRPVGTTRQMPARAPSWSWLSVDGQIAYHHVTDDEVGPHAFSDVQIVDIKATQHDNGTITGTVTLQGALIPIRVVGKQVSFIPKAGLGTLGGDGAVFYEPGFPSDQRHAHIIRNHPPLFESDNGTIQDCRAFLLHMGFCGLVLVPVEGTGLSDVFSRIGICVFDSDMVRVLANDFHPHFSKLDDLISTVTIV